MTKDITRREFIKSHSKHMDQWHYPFSTSEKQAHNEMVGSS
jgi:hypothetical protein